MNRAERSQVALRASIIAFIVFVVFALAGTVILSLFGITLPAFRVAGGLLLFSIAFEMVFERRQQRHENTAQKRSHPGRNPWRLGLPARHPADGRAGRDLRDDPAVR